MSRRRPGEVGEPVSQFSGFQLMYLAEGEVLRYSPDESDLLATERKVAALWKVIERARDAGDWRPRPSRLASTRGRPRGRRLSDVAALSCWTNPRYGGAAGVDRRARAGISACAGLCS